MAEKSFGLAVSEVGTAKGRVASFTAAPYGSGTKNAYNQITSFDNLWSDVFFHRLFLNVFMWCYRDNINYSEGDGVYLYITDPENEYIKSYFDESLMASYDPADALTTAGVKQTFGYWSTAEPFTTLTNGGLNVVWTAPWYEDDTQTNMNNYHKAGCHIILPSVNATRGLRMPDDRQAEIIRNVSDMAGHYSDEDSTQPQGNWRSGFYNALSDDGRGCGLITFEWFHYLQQIRPGGAFTIQDPSKYVKLYNPDDVAWRQMARSSSEVMHTVSGLYDLTPIDVDNNSIILSAAEQIKYTKETIEEGEPFYQTMQDTLGLGVPDNIEFQPNIETESYDATMSRLAVLKNNPLVTSAAIYTTNITAAVATTTTTTTTTTTISPSEQTRVAVGTVNIIDSCGPYNMSISGRDASYFELDHNVIYLLSTNPPPGYLKIEILLEDHFRPKRFPDIRRPFEIEFDQCKAPIIADRTAANRTPAYSYRRPQSEDFNIESEDYNPPDPLEMLWSVTRPTIAITPFTEYAFSGEGTEAKPFKAELGGGHSDSNVLWMKVQDYLAFEFPYTVTYKIIADSADDENFFLFVSESAASTSQNLTIDTLPSSPTYNEFKLDNAAITAPENIFSTVDAKYIVTGIPTMYRNDIYVSSTNPNAGGYTQIPHGVSGVSYNYSGPYKNNITINVPKSFSNPSTDPADGGKSVLWLYHPTFAFLYNSSVKLLIDEPQSVVPKQHYSNLDNGASYTNSVQQYLNIPTQGFDCTNAGTGYNSSAIQFLSNDQDYTATGMDPDWLTKNWFQEYPNYSWMYYTTENSNNQPRAGGIPMTGQFVVKGPAHNGVNIVFGYMKSPRNTTGRDKCSLELTVNATLATTTTTTTTAEPTTTTTTTLPPLYDFEVEMVDINPATIADVLSGDVAPDSSQTVGSNANSIKKEVREGQTGDPVYVFDYTAPDGQYYSVKPTLIILESNPTGFISYTTNVTLNSNKFGGEARVTLTDIPPEGTIGERKYLKFLIQGNTVPTTTTTTTTPVPTTTTTTTTTPPPCNNLIDILCKQTIKCTYNSFTDQCDTQIIGHEIVAETCCNISTTSINILVNNYLDLNPSQRSGCVSNTALYAPCNDPNDDNVCEAIVEEYKFIASISCT
jgi:hypothetical protein